MKIRPLLPLLLCLLGSGCASITRGTTEAFVIETTSSGAQATLTNGMSCETPCSVKVKRRSDFTVTIEKEGFETARASVTSSVDGAGAAGMAGNVLIGGIIGAGIDAGTGAMHSHKPNPLVVELTPISEVVGGEGGSTVFMMGAKPISDAWAGKSAETANVAYELTKKVLLENGVNVKRAEPISSGAMLAGYVITTDGDAYQVLSRLTVET